jgi:hypothetical protein
VEIPPLVFQTAGSLIAILALAGLARWMKLGGTPTLDTEDALRRAADEVVDGFTPVEFAIAGNRTAALARDAQGRTMLIKLHGNRFAGRILGPAAQARLRQDLDRTTLEVDCGEARFGKVWLDLPDAQAWATAINRINGTGHA